ncbi:hypothetical protein AB4Z18_03065 [Leifsonia sp. 2TAF2]|uniref:hypothetical protein n=1 Tax=Leifsonia sp. 2TAF2 TaxID=3233009 RepID=UPI003F99DB8C
MSDSDLRARPRWCSRCGARTRVVVNPYYGVGLAVHQYLSACKRCGLVEFIPTTRLDAERGDVCEPQAALPHETMRSWIRTHRIALSVVVVLLVLSTAMVVEAIIALAV